MPRSISRTAVLLLVLCCCAAVPASAQEIFYQVYEDGIKAFTAGDLPLAERKFMRALELDGRQSRQKRYYGVVFKPYIPEYYLGLIAIRQQQYQRGIEYLARVEKSGLLKKGDAEFPTLESQRQVAQDGLRPASNTAVAANSVPPSAPTGDRSRVPSSSPPQTTSEPTRALAPQNPASSSASNTTIPPLTTPQPNPGASTADAAIVPETRPTPAAAAAAAAPITPPSAVTTTNQLQDDIGRLLARREYEPAWRQAVGLNRTAAETAMGREQRARVRTAMVRDVKEQMSRPDLAEADRLLETLARLDQRDGEVTGLMQRVRDLRVILSAEREALSHLLKGEYPETVRVASQLIDNHQESPRLLFYAACGHAALALVEGDDRTTHSQRAHELFSRATLSGPAFQNEERYISPNILQLLRGSSR
jgi:hypothetical protein